MKTTINIYGKPVEIELTPEQIKRIQNQYTDYMDIKTFDDVCIFLGVDQAEFENENNHLPRDVYAYMQLRLISQALNGRNHMNYENGEECKFFPWFNAVGSSSGFSYEDSYYDRDVSNACSRLAFKSRKIAEHAGRTFIDIYNKYIN